MASVEPSPFNLGEYLRTLRRRKWIVILAVLLVVGSALIASAVQTPVYQGTAEVLLQPGSTTDFLFRDEQRVRAVQTEIRVLKSAPVREAVTNELGTEAPEVVADPIPQTEVFEVKARDADPEQAAAIANAYVNAYIEYRRSQAVDDLLAAGGGLQTQIDALQGQIDGLTQQISSASEDDRESVESNLGSQRDALVSQQALLKQSLDQLQVSTPLVTGGAQLVNPATPTDDPVEPLPLRNGLLGLGMGLLIGIGLALAFDRLDDTINGKDDLGRAAPRVPIIGLIPTVSGWRRRGDARLISRSSPNSPVAEAYRSLRTSISFFGIDQDVHTIQVTSPSASEGKTTTVANLALALARAGQRVTIMSCDLRRPRVHHFFDLPNEVGFTTVLLGEVSVSQALQSVPGEQNLSVLASGPVPPNPSELLSSQRTLEVLTTLQSRSDVVLIDSAPVLPVTDAAVLASRGFPTLLVASVGKTSRKRMSRAIELLGQVDALIIGAVLNGVGQDDEMGYGYGYRYEQESSQRSHFWERSGTSSGVEGPVPPAPPTPNGASPAPTDRLRGSNDEEQGRATGSRAAEKSRDKTAPAGTVVVGANRAGKGKMVPSNGSRGRGAYRKRRGKR